MQNKVNPNVHPHKPKQSTYKTPIIRKKTHVTKYHYRSIASPDSDAVSTMSSSFA